MPSDEINHNPKITVADFVERSFSELKLNVIAGENGLTAREISSPRIQKLGLALAGVAQSVHEGRIQIVGQTEISYLEQLESNKRIEALSNLDLRAICCILVTKGLIPPIELVEIADTIGLPVIGTSEISSLAIFQITKYLQEVLALHTTLHGVLVGMYGIGILLRGDSGLGKSECALDLITRGHRLISDDSVVIKKIGDALEGSSPELTREYLEVRGLGIINIRELFGVSAVRRTKRIDLVIEFKKWNEVAEIERLSLETLEEEILGVRVSKFLLPVTIGRNLSTLVETAVRVYLLKTAGVNPARELIEKHRAFIQTNSVGE